MPQQEKYMKKQNKELKEVEGAEWLYDDRPSLIKRIVIWLKDILSAK